MAATATIRKKLIEVALPLEAINREAAREKSIRHGHPSTLHLWWARRPLAAARAVIFAQMVDDPGSVPEEFPTVEAQEKERQRLFKLIEELVLWENTTNEDVLNRARAEIRRSWARWCKESGEDPEKLPPFHDPFAGGGALPLEAQRLGLEAHASDLNPVAVMINKAMIEIPARFAGRPPVNPDAHKDKQLIKKTWRGAAGLAEDVRYYGLWMRDEAEKRIGHLYPKVTVTTEVAKGRADLKPYVGRELTVIAWLWARTVESSNPAYRGCHVPLVSSFWVSTKPGKETWVEPIVDGKSYMFEVRTGRVKNKAEIDAGTKLGRGANFRCVLSQSPLSTEYIRSEAQAGRMGTRLMAIVTDGNHGRIYLPPTQVHEELAMKVHSDRKPDQKFFQKALGFRIGGYGLTEWSDFFTNRQLVALTTFSDLVTDAREVVRRDALAARLSGDERSLRAGGTGALAYAEAVSVYLAFSIDKAADYWSAFCSWHSSKELIRNTFGRNALPMMWDFAETNAFSDSAGNVSSGIDWARKALVYLPVLPQGVARQENARTKSASLRTVISTDPPYYDNIGYADLSDFFYIWMRRSLQAVYPELFGTMLVPKDEELVATPARHGSRSAAEAFFLNGMTDAMRVMAEQSHPAFPITVYYAFRQTEGADEGVSSTGWETFLDAAIRSGFLLSGTWPMRTELGNRIRNMESNALASSIVLVCRSRLGDRPMATRKDLLSALRRELPPALRQLQLGNIAPVDLAQASIGPGMAIFSRYGKILETDGTAMKVRTALQLINQTLDETLAEQDGDFDQETAWAVAWFEQFGFNDGPFGDAETLSKAKNTALNALAEAGIVKAGAGKARLLRPGTAGVPPASSQKHPTVWMFTHLLIHALESGGETAAADLLRANAGETPAVPGFSAIPGGNAEVARELAYRLYSVCERRKRAAEALAYNALVQSWPEITRLAREGGKPKAEQGEFL